jgi:hypothetical protein
MILNGTSKLDNVLPSDPPPPHQQLHNTICGIATNKTARVGAAPENSLRKKCFQKHFLLTARNM